MWCVKICRSLPRLGGRVVSSEAIRYWIGFNKVPGIGSARLRALLDFFGDLEIAWSATAHNLQQAARVADHTAFFMLGELVECSDTTTMFTNPRESITEEYITGRFG